MSLKYSLMPVNTFEELQMGAGILVEEGGFNPATGVVTRSKIMGATSGGFNFSTNPTYSDYGEDVDNCPPNTMQMKRLVSVDPSVSGTYLTVNPKFAASLAGAADVYDNNKVVPRVQLKRSDYKGLWVIGDYSNVNTGANAGYLAIHLKNTLNTTGFQIQTTKDEKGTMSFEYHAHYDMDNMDDIPYEIYCKAGSGEGDDIPTVVISERVISIGVGDDYTVSASVRNSDSSVTWTSGDSTVATVSGGVITGESAGNTVITASITDDGVTYTDTSTVIVE